MDHGIIRQIGSPRDIYDRPANVFVAGFMGTTNLLEGTISRVSGGEAVVRTANDIDVRVAGADGAAAGRAVHVSVRPEAATLTSQPPAGSSHNVWPGKVTFSTFLGDAIAYRLEVGGQKFEVHAPATDVFDAGADVFVAVHSNRCILLTE